MIFIKRKPGEALVLNTPSGEIVIQVMAGDELGIVAPSSVQVSSSQQAGSWLPSRPRQRMK